MHLNEEDFTEKKYFKLDFIEVGLVLAIFFLGFIIAGVFQFLTIQLVSADVLNNFVQPIAWVIPFLCAMVGFYFIKLKPETVHYNFGFKLSTWYLYPLFILMFFGGMLINEPLAELIPTSGLGGVLDEFYKLLEEMERMMLQYPISTVFMIVILAPVFEELLFRGVILKGMLNNKVAPWKAILISALIFGIIHMNPWQFVGATLLGILLGYVYYKTQSIINVMLLHFLNNGLGVFLYYQYNEMNLAEALNISPLGSVVFGLVFLLLFGFLFYHFTKNKKWKFY